jgi:hypothetical protein
VQGVILAPNMCLTRVNFNIHRQVENPRKYLAVNTRPIAVFDGVATRYFLGFYKRTDNKQRNYGFMTDG